MKPFALIAVSAVYALVAGFIWMLILLQCGLGPDSPVACNERADSQAFWFVIAAVAFYLIVSIAIWRLKRVRG